MKKIHVYIHIPFCLAKCYYCDFNSFKTKEEDYFMYVEALVNEISNFDFSNKIIETIYFGGGTPTVLPVSLLGKIEMALAKSNISKTAEITVEANPETLSNSYIKDLKFLFFNRLSLGLQTTDNNLLKKIGRLHTYEKFLENYCILRENNFDNINLDLMFSLPNQTIENYKKSVETVCTLNPEHISSYSISLYEGTKFYEDFSNNKLILPSEDEDRKMYLLTEEILENRGYKRYEISNYSKIGYESRHNISYWQRKEYVGFGLSAHSYVNGIRYNNTNSFAEYINSKGIGTAENIEILSKTNKMEEFCFLGLRLIKGINKGDFEKEFGKNFSNIYGDVIEELEKDKLVVISKNNIMLTNKGLDLSNYVFGKFLK